MTQCETNILCQFLLVSSKMSQVTSMAILMFEVIIHPVFFMGFLDFSCHTTRHMCRSWRKKPWQSYPRIHHHLPWWCEPRTDGVVFSPRVVTDANRRGGRCGKLHMLTGAEAKNFGFGTGEMMRWEQLLIGYFIIAHYWLLLGCFCFTLFRWVRYVRFSLGA